MPQFALEMRQISKTYGAVRANDSISFAVPKGTIHALAGENGAGKSTLMKILFGLVSPDQTQDENAGIYLDGKKVQFRSALEAISEGIGMVQQHFALAGALTALDNIILGSEPKKNGFIDRTQAQKTLEDLAQGELSVPWNKNTQDLSVGMQQRLEILKLLFRHAQILILDEPTAVLTPQEVQVFFGLLKRLRSEGKTIILITHKLQEVLSLCDNVTVLRHGAVTGNFAVKDMTQETLIRAMIGRDIKPVPRAQIKVGENLVEIKDLHVEESHRGSLKGISLKIKEGEILGIAGVEGNGQQALVEALLGISNYEGSILFKGKPLRANTSERRKKFNFGLISEDRHEQSLWLNASVADNTIIGLLHQFSRFGFLNKKEIEQHAEKTLAPYGVRMESVKVPVASLSGGNQQKIVVAREVSMRNPPFLIASQPTRGVDVGAIEFIHQEIVELQKKGAGILLISSELEELCQLSDRIVVLYEGKAIQEFQGPQFDVRQIGQAMTAGNKS